MTTVERIISRHCGLKKVEAGETHFVKFDLAIGTELVFPQVLKFLSDIQNHKIIGREEIALINGHLVPTKEAAAGTLVKILDQWANDQKIARYYQTGRSGNCQTVLAEHGLIKPGALIIGSDQHVTTYGALGALATGIGGVDLASAWATGEIWLTVPDTVNINLFGELGSFVTSKDLAFTILSKLGPEGASGKALEFNGDGLNNVDMEGRFILCNMLVETGAKFVFMPFDHIAKAYLEETGYKENYADVDDFGDANYVSSYEIDLSEIVPMVATPYLPTNCVPASTLADIEVTQVIIGSCTNGRIQDFRLSSRLLKRHPIHPNVKLGYYPSSHQVIRELLDEGLALLFTQKGASISPPSCLPCLGSGPSLLGEDEVGVYTTNRNYQGRHGPLTAKVYLASPLTATATAIKGKITDPRDL